MNDEQGILRRLDHYADCIEKGVHVTGTQLKSLVKDIRESGLISSQQPPSAPAGVDGEFDKMKEDMAIHGTGVLRIEHVPHADFHAQQPPAEAQGVAEKWWGEVCDALSEADPDWMLDGPGGIESAVAMIRKLAARPAEAQPVAWANKWELEAGNADGLIAMRHGKHDPERKFFTVPLFLHPPPSAPVGAVSVQAIEWLQGRRDAVSGLSQDSEWLPIMDEILSALAQQPAPSATVGVEEADAFEAWARPRFKGKEVFDRIEGRPGGWEYNGDTVQAAWSAWQERSTLAHQPAPVAPVGVEGLTTVRFLDGGIVQMDRADYDKLAQQPAAVDGAVRWFDSCAEMFKAVHGKEWAAEAQSIRDALAQQPTAVDGAAVRWAVERWNDEVANRPLVNVYRRTLDITWRQVIRHFGGDDVALCGPRHDDLAAQPGGSDNDR